MTFLVKFILNQSLHDNSFLSSENLEICIKVLDKKQTHALPHAQFKTSVQLIVRLLISTRLGLRHEILLTSYNMCKCYKNFSFLKRLCQKCKTKLKPQIKKPMKRSNLCWYILQFMSMCCCFYHPNMHYNWSEGNFTYLQYIANKYH